MKKTTVLLFFLTVLPFSPSLLANDFKVLEGQYAIGSKTIIDPQPYEKKDRVYLSIHGGTAKEIFDSITSPAKRDKCDREIRTKSAGALECSKSPGGVYHCSVGILLTTGATVQGRVC